MTDEKNKKETDDNGAFPSSTDKLIELEKKCDEYLNNWKRAAADMANYKKEEIERIGMTVQYTREDMILKIMPILDNICYATRHIKDKGLEQIQKQAEEFLRREGAEEIKTTGQAFNPETMEIAEEVEGGESGTVAEELQKGYKIGDKVIRPAKIKINK